MASGQIPTPDSPPSASPLSLSRTRRYFGGVAWVIIWRGCSNRLAPSQIKAKADGNGGAHFSFLGSAEFIQRSHLSLPVASNKSEARTKRSVGNGVWSIVKALPITPSLRPLTPLSFRPPGSE